MAELVGVFAASHGPLVARDWDKLPAARKARLEAAYDALRKRLRAAAPESRQPTSVAM